MAVKSSVLPFPDLPDSSCRKNSSCPPTFLVTAQNQSFGLGMATNMFPDPSVNSSDLLSILILGTEAEPQDNYLSDPAFTHHSELYYLQPKCNGRSSVSVPIETKTLELECLQALTLWRNSSSEINNEIFKGEPSANAKEEYDFAGAYDFLNSDSSNFNVTVWYQTNDLIFTDASIKSPTRIEQLVNLVTNAYLQFSRGTRPKIVLEFIKDMPTHNYMKSPSGLWMDPFRSTSFMPRPFT